MAGGYRQAIEDGPPLVAESVLRSGPAGLPISVWGFVNVTRGRRRSPRVYSSKNLAWLRKELADPPSDATLGLSVLDADGYLDESPLRIRVQREEESADWVGLSVEAPERDLVGPVVQQRWLGLLRSVAEVTNPAFGQLDYDGLVVLAVNSSGVVARRWGH